MTTLRKTVLLGAAAAFLLGSPASAEKSGRLNDLRGLQLENAKIPVLHQGKLQMVIFSSRNERRGEVMLGTDTVLAVVRKGADPDMIRDDWNLRCYPLEAPLPEVLEFWKPRIVYSEGIMTTPAAEINSMQRRADGSRDVHFRSPMLDLDGVGFEADFDRRTILVNSQVRIVIRQNSADPTELLKTPGKLPPKYEYITARGDSLMIDTRNNKAVLLGNVRVDEAQGFLTCDRLTIFWNSGANKNADKGKRMELTDIHGSGVERVFADGNVVITNRDKPDERIFAEHLVCEVPTGRVKLWGEAKYPRLVSGNGEKASGRVIFFERNSKRGWIVGDCRIESPAGSDAGDGKKQLRILTADKGYLDGGGDTAEFTGNVAMREGERTISCGRLRLVTSDRGGKKAQPKSSDAEAGTGSLLGSPDLGTGGKTLKYADFHDHVVLREGGKGPQLGCDRMHADFSPGNNALRGADFHGHVTMRDASGGRLDCDRMHADFAPENNALTGADFRGHVTMRDASGTKLDCGEMHADFAPGDKGGTDIAGAQWYDGVRVEYSGSDGTPPSVVTAECGEFDGKGNRVTFERNVRGTREKTTLNCERLDLYLAGKKSATAPEAASKAANSATPVPGSIAIGAGSDRVLRKVVATDKVRIVDASGKLDCDKLTFFFSEPPPGAKAEPGMFQAGGAMLTDVLAEGHVVGVNRASAESKQQPGLLQGRSRGDRIIYADRGQADLTEHLSHFSGNVRVKDDEKQLDCDDMYLYGVRRIAPAAVKKAGAAAAPKPRQTEDPDADPYALPGFTEDNVPSVINITDDVQLEKILCVGNVRMLGADPDSKRTLEAGGGRALYVTGSRVVTLTDTPPRKPWLRLEGREQHASRIVYDLNDNIFKSYDTDTFNIEPAP